MDLLGHMHIAWTIVAIETKLVDALDNQGHQCSNLGLTSSCMSSFSSVISRFPACSSFFL
jgi:hypothetical protein